MPSCAPQAARSPRHRRLSGRALRFVTDEGDHLRQFLYAVRAPWQTDGVQTDFVHALRLVDGIYPAAAITPYRDLTAALRTDDLLQVKAVRYETVTRELPFETQTIEDAGLDFGKTETVQAGRTAASLSPARSQPWRARSSAPA